MNRTEIGQGTLASTNRLLLRGFSCEFCGLLDRIVLYAIASIHTSIHSNQETNSTPYKRTSRLNMHRISQTIMNLPWLERGGERSREGLRLCSRRVTGRRITRRYVLQFQLVLTKELATCTTVNAIVGSMLRRRRSSREKRLLAEAVCMRWPKVPFHEALTV